jgi:hypothetical protein
MTSFDEAAALADKENKPFYRAAFLIQYWLGGLLERATAEYAEKERSPSVPVTSIISRWRELPHRPPRRCS